MPTPLSRKDQEQDEQIQGILEFLGTMSKALDKIGQVLAENTRAINNMKETQESAIGLLTQMRNELSRINPPEKPLLTPKEEDKDTDEGGKPK